MASLIHEVWFRDGIAAATRGSHEPLITLQRDVSQLRARAERYKLFSEVLFDASAIEVVWACVRELDAEVASIETTMARQRFCFE